MLIHPLPDGPVDIIGDVHGELAPLKALLQSLGYAPNGDHPDGRRLVFVGDLVDRGPSNVEVIDLVNGLVATDRARCVLGNHELNILRDDRKRDNQWFFNGTAPTDRSRILDFINNLPLALERPGLRIAHACWNDDSIAQARAFDGSVIDCFQQAEHQVVAALEEEGVTERANRERDQQSLRDRDKPPPPALPNFAASEYRQQIENPVKVVTSGVERVADKPFWANGKWRYTQRVPWWNHYTEDSQVVVGHYWRSRDASHSFLDKTEEADLFAPAGPTDALGPTRRVMCIDYSIGWRSKERTNGNNGPFRTALAAYRVTGGEPPELVFSPG